MGEGKVPPVTDYAQEWEYLYDERLGMICADSTPTEKEDQAAADYATKEVARLKKLNSKKPS